MQSRSNRRRKHRRVKVAVTVLVVIAAAALSLTGCPEEEILPDPDPGPETTTPAEEPDTVIPDPPLQPEDPDPDVKPEQSEQEAAAAEGQGTPVVADGDYLLALVTKNTTLRSDYVPPDLVPVPADMNPYYDMSIRQVALEPLERLYRAADRDGVSLSIRSAYRSYRTQERLFKDYAARYGEEEANRFSARPGQSEHQLGTAVDFGGTSVDFKTAFADTEQGLWLADQAYRFGFALSYPRDAEHITGYIFEPWHYRYIGVEAAREWRESGVTLKEYLRDQPQLFE